MHEQHVAAGPQIAGSPAWALAQLADGRSVPLFHEIPADLDTPVGTYLKLRDRGPSFLLESVEGGESLARLSFVGSAPRATMRLRDGHAHAEALRLAQLSMLEGETDSGSANPARWASMVLIDGR